MNFYLKLTTQALILAAILFGQNFILAKPTQAVICKFEATLIDSNKQAIKAMSITRTDWNKYGVRFIFSGCSTAIDSYKVSYSYKEGTGTPTELYPTETTFGNATRDIMFGGKPKVATYTYSAVAKDANSVGGGILVQKPDLTASVSVNFVDGPTMSPTGNPTGNPTNSNTNTSTNTNTTKTFEKLDTTIGVEQRVDYDAPIGYLQNLLNIDSVPGLIVRLLQIMLGVIGVVTTIILILSGFRLVAMGDNEAERTKAKKAITWAIIGLVVSLLSFSIVAIVQRLITQG